MTEKAINEKLVHDIFTIMTVTEELIPNYPKEYNWPLQMYSIGNALNHNQEQQFIDLMDRVLVKYEGKDEINGVINIHFISNTKTLLKYRLEQNQNPEIDLTFIDTHRENALAVFQSLVSNPTALNDFLYENDNTILPYALYEIIGSGNIKQLNQLLDNELPFPVTLELVKRTEPRLYREKTPYLGHKIWACYQTMPYLILSLES